MRTTDPQRIPELSLVYVNFRSVRLLGKSLESLEKKGIFAAGTEVIIANNDQVEKWAVEGLCRRFPIRTAFIGENRGFGSAANQAASLASGSVIGFLNPDAELSSGDLYEPVEILKKYRNVGVVGAALVSDHGEAEEWSAGKHVTLWQIIRNNLGIPTGRRIWTSGKTVSAGFVSGAALFIRRSLFRELSGFDEGFFLYFEDADLCLRSEKRGFLTVRAPGVTFLHRGGKSHASRIAQKQAFRVSQERYFMKHRPRWEYELLRFLNKC